MKIYILYPEFQVCRWNWQRALEGSTNWFRMSFNTA